MKRTQIQMPDALYDRAHEVADMKEISLAELVRRGLEYMIAVSASPDRETAAWELPRPHALNANDPFAQENWREQLHNERAIAAENRATYGKKKRK